MIELIQDLIEEFTKEYDDFIKDANEKIKDEYNAIIQVKYYLEKEYFKGKKDALKDIEDKLRFYDLWKDK